MMTLEGAKAWFTEHRKTILDSHGRKHHLQKEDLLLIIGTLDTKDYALCSSGFTDIWHMFTHNLFLL